MQARPRRRGGTASSIAVVTRVVVALAVAAVVGLLAPSPPAGAHAAVLATDPIDGAVLPEAPARVSITFSEPVTLAGEGVRVLDAAGGRVDAGDARAEGAVADVGLPAGTPDGSYIVAWQVISADGHPVSGAFTFSVGTVAAGVDASAYAPPTAGAVLDTAETATSALALVGVLLAAGAALFLVVAHDGSDDRRSLVRLVRGAAAVGAVALLVGLPLHAVVVAGGDGGVLADVSGLASAIGGSTVAAAAVGLAGLAVVAAGVGGGPTRGGRVAAGVGALVAASSFAVAGHDRATAPELVAIGSNVVHAVAGAVWFGGLVALAAHLRWVDRSSERGGDVGRPAVVVKRFSDLATLAVVAVALAGALLGWLIVGGLDHLVSSTYGRLLLAKVALFVVVAALGAWNHLRLVPAVETEPSSDRRLRLLRVVRVEAVVLVAVLVLTAVLARTSPEAPASAVGPEATEASSTVAFEGGTLDVTVTPTLVGPNTLRFTVLDPSGAPLDLVEPPRVEVALSALQLGPLARTARPVPGATATWEVEVDLTVAGTWDVAVDLLVSDFAEPRARFPVTVR